MLRVILFLILVSLLLLGFADFLHYIWQAMISPKRKPKRFYVVYLDGDNDYQTLYWLSDKIKWQGHSLCDKTVAITNKDTDTEVIKTFKDIGIVFLNEEDIKKYGEIYERAVKGHG